MDQGIASVAVVAATDSSGAEAQVCVERPCGGVVRGHLQGRPLRSSLPGLLQERLNHALSQTLPPVAWIHGQGCDLQFIQDQQSAGEGQQLIPSPEPQPWPLFVGQFSAPLVFAPEPAQGGFVQGKASAEVLGPEGLKADLGIGGVRRQRGLGGGLFRITP